MRLKISLILFILSFSYSLNSYSEDRSITKEVLSNGLTVIIEEDSSAPIVNYQMWVNVGSADEKESEYGIAHVYEHMLFKGTDKRGVGEVAKEIESLGGTINAYTSFDKTVYHFTINSEFYKKGLDIMSDVIINSSFDPDELSKELEVVVEEIKRGKDNAPRQVYLNLLSESYDTHPYGRPVIGSEESVRGLTREYILDFYGKWYIPNNMVLVVVGDVDKDKILKDIKTYFGNFKNKTNLHEARPVEATQLKTKAKHFETEFTQTYLALAFHIPELKHNDVYAIDMLSEILGSGASSRLYKKLKTEKQLVDSIDSYAMTPKEPGIFMIQSPLKSKNVYATLESIIDVITEFQTYGPSDDELNRAKTVLSSSFVYGKETMEAKASSLGYYETAAGDLAFDEKYTAMINKTSKEDLIDVAIKYLTKENLTALVLQSSKENEIKINEKGLIKAISKNFRKYSKLHHKKKSIVKKKTKLEPKLTTLNINGKEVKIITEQSPSPELFSIYMAVPGGLRYESDSNNGISSFTASMLNRGTKTYNKTEFSDELDKIAGSLRGFSGKHTIGISGKFLSKDFDRAFELFEDILLNPVFDNEEFELLRKDTISAIESQVDYLPGYTFKLLYKKLYPNHPYRLNSLGTIESVNTLNKESLKKFYEKVFYSQDIIISVTGNVNKAKVVEKIKSIASKIPTNEKTANIILKSDPSPTAIILTGDEKNKEQTNVGIGFMGSKIGDKDSYVLEVITEILGSHGGRLFTELRDKKSLAYAVSAFSRPGIEDGFIGFYIGCAPDKASESITSILEEINKLKTTKVSTKELNQAKMSITGGFNRSRQRTSSRATQYVNNELMGSGFMDYKTFNDKINKITKKDIIRVSNKYFKDDNYVLSIVGKDWDKVVKTNNSVK